MRRLLLAFVLLGVLFAVAPSLAERLANRLEHPPPYPAPAWARELMRGYVDLHADPLLWGRDLLKRGSRGHVDLPRLQQAGARLQVFGVVTQAPLGMNLESNRDRFDMVSMLAVSSRWPMRTWNSRLERALYQAERLREMSRRSGGALVLVQTRADLAAVQASGRVGALLGLEGSQALQGDLHNLDALGDAGFRMLAPAHFVDTEVAGSAHGEAKGGLTALGRAWVRRMEEKKLILDLAHASPDAVDEILAIASRPVVVSHTGVKGTCDNRRNLSDGQLRALAKNGALVGIGFWEAATCGTDAAAVARAMRHAASVMGVAHLALGSDFDGAVPEPFDSTGVPTLAEALRAERFTDDEIRAIASGNALRFFSAQLP